MGKRSLETSDLRGCIVRSTLHWCWWVLAALILFPGCVHIPVASDLTVEDKLPVTLPLDQGDVIVVYGENAKPKDDYTTGLYLTAGCMATFQTDTIGALIKTILETNPVPGKFAVRHLSDLEREPNPELSPTAVDSILGRLNLSKAKVLKDRLRYAIHVKEAFEAMVHVPLYVPPFGTATCGNRTSLEASVWELPTEQPLGSLSISAKGEYVVVAYMFHVVVFPDTQKDATRRLAREIVERLTGVKQDEKTAPLNPSSLSPLW
jgi:hypothetical protein